MWDPTGKNATNVLKLHIITLFILVVCLVERPHD